MTTYYNDNEPFAAQWLRNLIAAGHLPAGDVDERPIQEVQPDDVKTYTQAHFFAGIGGWAYALRLAGWPDDRPVWTGSCPCQPFSAAGKQQGHADPRHLWPEWFRLLRAVRPPTVFGEQVAGAVRHGWLDLVFGDLEGEGYACGAVVLGAHSVGAPHLRQRLYFVGDTVSAGSQGRGKRGHGTHERAAWAAGLARELADAECGSPERRRYDVGTTPSESEREAWERERVRLDPWAGGEFIPCRDGKARPVEPGTFPLAHGIPGRVGRLRAYGNAIVPQVAAAFVSAVMACRP